RRRRAAGHHAFEPAAAAHAPRALDELAQRDRDRFLVDAGPVHAAGHGIQTRAALGLGPEPGEPGGPAVDDVRHERDRLDVVHDRRRAERALDRRERRLHLRPALLALERGDEPGLFAADVGAGPAVDDDVEAVAEIAGVVRLAHGGGEAPPRLDVFTADVDEAGRAANGARRDDHAFDE